MFSIPPFQVLNSVKPSASDDVHRWNLLHSVATYAMAYHVFHKHLLLHFNIRYPIHLPDALDGRTCTRVSSTKSDWTCSLVDWDHSNLLLARDPFLV